VGHSVVVLSMPPIINGVPVPQLRLADDVTMAREAIGHLLGLTQGWKGADKAAFWRALSAQIEARHAPAWVSAPFRGQNGEYIFSGGQINVHGMIILDDGTILRIPHDATITPDFTNPGTAQIHYRTTP
jgi:hypothetical protein